MAKTKVNTVTIVKTVVPTKTSAMPKTKGLTDMMKSVK